MSDNPLKPTSSQDSNSEDELFVSKTAIKKEMFRFQELGQSLLNLPEKKLDSAPLSDSLQYELKLALKMPNNNARRRQLQRVGKLIRNEDYEAIGNYINQQHSLNEKKQAEKRSKKQEIERVATTLVQGDKAVLAEFIQLNPEADRQRLAQFIRNSKKEQKEGELLLTKGKHTLKLMDFIQTLL